jgi:hypothetical protein
MWWPSAIQSLYEPLRGRAQDPVTVSTASASAGVVGGAIDGPEPTRCAAAAPTSARINVDTRAGAAAAASRPPFTADRWVRTVFRSAIGALT